MGVSEMPDTMKDRIPSDERIPVKHISPGQFANYMSAIRRYAKTDPEGAHKEAVEIMCTVLKYLGYGEGVLFFENMEK